MNRMNAKISINGVLLGRVAQVNIESSWEQLTQVAVVDLPNNFVRINQDVTQQIKRGDKIEIDLGYGEKINRRFTGYIKNVSIESPYRLECEDEMYRMKQRYIRNYTAYGTTLQGLIDSLFEQAGITDIQTNLANTNLGDFKVNNATIADILETLKSNYGLSVFFRDSVLIIGLPFTQVQGSEYSYTFDGQDGVVINDDLQWQDAETIGAVVRGESIDMLTNERIIMNAFYNNKGEIETTKDDVEGSVNSKVFLNLTEKQLKEAIILELQQISYTGFTGSFTTFGHRNIKPGDIVIMSSNKYEGVKSGRYYVRAVSDAFGSGGYRHNIHLDRKA